jgi:hypothetical protein
MDCLIGLIFFSNKAEVSSIHPYTTIPSCFPCFFDSYTNGFLSGKLEVMGQIVSRKAGC